MLVIKPNETLESIKRKAKEFCDSDKLILDNQEFEEFVKEAMKMYILEENEIYFTDKIRATKIEEVEYEDYLPASTAGIYAGTYRYTEEIEQEVEVLVTARINEDGIEIEVEEW